LRTQHSVFRVRCRGARGVRLQEPPCADHEGALRHPAGYGPTQRLGAALRRAGIDLFEFVSARDPAGGVNLALFRPDALVSRAPLGLSRWLCETRATAVTFAPEASPELHVLALDTFLVDGRLPRPAA
jgi:hypothetical protein